MKKVLAVIGILVLAAGLLTACGSKGNGSGETQQVDLSAFWDAEEQKYQWGKDYFADLDDELMEDYYPGLKDISTKQLIVKVPMMSAVVQEMVFAEADNEEDAGKIAEILQKRADDQAAGGAWYPESMEEWEKAKVVTHGCYAALVAVSDNGDEIVSDFNALFDEQAS